MSGELNARARKILYAAVTEFIATGDPVGSRTLARKYGLDLSAASIRNVLADLEEAGYLHQPHTSAGRVPTDRALRLFINTLVEVRTLSHNVHPRVLDDLGLVSALEFLARRTREGSGGAVQVRVSSDAAAPVLTGVVTPAGFDADALRKLIHDRFDHSLGTGLGKVKGRMFRIGHLGDCNDLTLIAALGGVEMGFKLAGVPTAASGVEAAMAFFAAHPPAAQLQSAA